VQTAMAVSDLIFMCGLSDLARPNASREGRRPASVGVRFQPAARNINRSAIRLNDVGRALTTLEVARSA